MGDAVSMQRSGSRATVTSLAETGRVPRSDVEAERAVLAAVLLDGDCSEGVLARTSAVLAPDDFYHPAHGVVFDAMLALGARSEPIDIITLADELRRRERLNTVGGAQFLGELTESMPTTAHCETHAQIVADHAFARRMRNATFELATRADTETPEALLELASQLFTRASQARGRAKLKSMSQVLVELCTRIEQQGGQGEGMSVPTGFRRLDVLSGGLRGGMLTLLAGRPGMGKTAFVENIVTNVARADRTVLFFSEEMPAREVVNRRVSADAELDARKALAGSLNPDEVARYFGAAHKASGLPIWFEDSGRVSAVDIATLARRARFQLRSVALIVVDYVQRLRPIDPAAPKNEQVGASARELKNLAKELDVPVVVLSQLNRDVEKRPDKRPTAADLRDSGELEQEADLIACLFREWVYDRSKDPTRAELIVAKHRGGPCFETIPLLFDGPRTLFSDVPEDDEPPEPYRVGGYRPAGAPAAPQDEEVPW